MIVAEGQRYAEWRAAEQALQWGRNLIVAEGRVKR